MALIRVGASFVRSAGRLLHRDHPVRRLGGAAVGVEQVVNETELDEEEGPELRLLDASSSMGDGGARAAQEEAPRALGDRVAFVDVGGRKGALDCEDGAKRLFHGLKPDQSHRQSLGSAAFTQNTNKSIAVAKPAENALSP